MVFRLPNGYMSMTHSRATQETNWEEIDSILYPAPDSYMMNYHVHRPKQFEILRLPISTTLQNNLLAM